MRPKTRWLLLLGLGLLIAMIARQVMTQLASVMGGNGSLGGLNVPQIGSALNLDKLKR